MEPYYKYSAYLRDRYGEKTYKLPVNLPLTCPNRDGQLGNDGCYYCGEQAAGFESEPDESVRDQLLEMREYIGDRYKVDKFIAYFQNYTNTYLPLANLKSYVREAMTVDDIVEIILSTRPDCVNYEYLQEIRNLVQTVNSEINLTLELGLQTVNYRTLENVNRGHTLAQFIDAVLTARTSDFGIGAHLIMNLPGDEMIDVKENARVLSALRVDNVKLHALYLREGTELARQYQAGEFEIISLKEYINRVITFLRYLDPRIAVQRLIGRAPEEGSVFVNWDTSWWKIHDMIIEEMNKRGIEQGDLFDYLQGSALAKFKN